jgi:DNA-binding MarR family transcriptional regulator
LWRQAITEALSPLEITHTQFFLLGSLHWLSRKGIGPNQRELAHHTGLDPMTTSQVLRHLERRGLVARHDDPEDMRAYRLRLTKRGEKSASEAITLVRSATTEFFAPLGDDIPRFVTALRKVSRAAGAAPELVGDG